MEHFTKERSAYFVGETEQEFSWSAFVQPAIKAIFVFSTACTLLYASVYGWRAGINVGIISSVFTISAIFFVVILYWIIYNQTLSTFDLVGISLIVVGVLIIGFGGQWRRDQLASQDPDQSQQIDQEE